MEVRVLSAAPFAGCGVQAAVAELADALASGASGGNPVEVRVLFSAPSLQNQKERPGNARPSPVCKAVYPPV